MFVKEFTSTLLPAGDYVITDPCYVIAEEKWSAFCDALDFDGNTPLTEFEGKPMFAFSTAYGDGSYECSGFDGTEHVSKMLVVDAGLMAIVPKALVERDFDLTRCALEVSFENSFYAIVNPDGRFQFGDYSVMTGCDYDNEDDWGDDWGDEDE